MSSQGERFNVSFRGTNDHSKQFTAVFEGYWKVYPEKGVCANCKALGEMVFLTKPDRPHPNCKCRIVYHDPAGLTALPDNVKNKPKRTYVRAMRPLAGRGELRKENFITTEINLRPVHEGLISPQDGSNVGFFGDNQIRADDPELMEYYSFGNVEYSADIIDESVDIIKEQYRQSKIKAAELSRISLYKKFNPYGLIANNCQDFVDEVINLAYKIAKKKGISLIWRPDY